MIADVDQIVWFVFNSPEAVGRVGVRQDQYGLGLYVPGADGPRRIASVDLFYQSPEGMTTLTGGQEPYVQLVIDDVQSDDPAAVVKLLPQETVVEIERGTDDFTFVSDYTEMPKRHLRLVVGRREKD